mmetsp:Transcript_15830/g.25826  ORF Transcript_15830/g.25826 Transcript_15830/m.25826 type:complete len:145 (+) Transcript_15830:59-493(+)
MVRGGSEEGKIGGNFEKKLQKYSELLERDVKGVGEFFSNLGYSEAAKKFIENKIEGRLLPGLTTDHLIRMGVNIVGDQLRIMEVRIRSGLIYVLRVVKKLTRRKLAIYAWCLVRIQLLREFGKAWSSDRVHAVTCFHLSQMKIK